MERQEANPDIHTNSVVVQKLKAGKRKLVVFDKDSTIQRHPHPIAHPSDSELSAGKEIREITAEYPVIISSAQVLELGIDSETYVRSVECGYHRPPPKILLPNGMQTSKPEEVKGWEYLLNPDTFIGLGTGIFPRQKSGVYLRDLEFEKALGGPLWRAEVFKDLNRLYPDRKYKSRLGPVDRDGLYESGDVDVAKLDFRIQFDDFGPDAAKDRDELCTNITKDQMEGRGFKNVTIVDESNPSKRLTTYLLPIYGEKSEALERYGNNAAFHAGVPTEDIEVIKFGDSPTDVSSGLKAFQGAKSVTLVMAAKSRISDCIHNNEDTFAGVPLLGSPNHPTLPGRYQETGTPGVYLWRGLGGQRTRRVILAEYTPWSKGLECTESVLATLKHLGF